MKKRKPVEYKTVDTTTLKGLREAERLHLAGWTQVRVGPFTTQFRSPLPKKNPPRRKTLGKRKARTMLKRHEFTSDKQRRFLGARASGQSVKRNTPELRNRLSDRLYHATGVATFRQKPKNGKAKLNPTARWEVSELIIDGKLAGYLTARTLAEANRAVERHNKTHPLHPARLGPIVGSDMLFRDAAAMAIQLRSDLRALPRLPVRR